MNNKGKIMTAVAAGAAAGALLGVLFAPDKGSETRKKITVKGKELAEGVKIKFQQGKEKFNDLKEDLARTMKEKVEDFA
jgi:gas vesicle protein